MNSIVQNTKDLLVHKRIQHIHMVGIGGSGMSGIAEVLLTMGYSVSGSDMNDSSVVQHLRNLGANIIIGHFKENVAHVDVLVRSSAIKNDNPELVEAQLRGIPIIPRAEMLAELMRLRTGIAIAGTHGKTTTTSLLAGIFHEAGLDPTVIIGGILNAYGSNAHLGSGQFLIAEADESDGSFLCLRSIMNAVTNIDLDHVDHYGDLESIDNAFVQFMNGIPFYGINVVCGDDPGVSRVLPRINRPVLTYGFGVKNDLRADIISLEETSRFQLRLKGCLLGEVELAHPGKHNILNALAAVGLAFSADISIEHCLAGLKKFTGVGRRFERKGLKSGVLVVDDYGHHPAEIRATVETARKCFPDRRLIVAFQPHRFSRTKALFGDFCKAFDGIDKLYLTEIYAASESPLPGISGEALAQGIRQVSDIQVSFHPDFSSVYEALCKELKSGDLLLTLGAGAINTVGKRWLDEQ